MVWLRANICSQTLNVTLTQRSIRRRGVAAGCAVVAAVGVAACGSNGAVRSGAASGPVASAASAATAPECLAANPLHSARPAGTSVVVTPTPGTVTGDPHTQISFVGAPASQIRSVSVHGSRSGGHQGAMRPYSQG